MFFSYYNYKTYKKAYHQGYLEVDDILIEGTPQHHRGASPTQHFDYGTPRGDFNTPGENEDELSNNGYFKNRKEDSNLATPCHCPHKAGHSETGSDPACLSLFQDKASYLQAHL